MRIVHVNDVANTGTAMVNALRSRGCEASLVRLKLAAGSMPLPLKLAALPARLVELSRVSSTVGRGRFDVVHIHYAYLGIIGILGHVPYVLHCHGTDIRLGLRSPLRRPVTLLSLQRAAAVLFSTPDLHDAVAEVRPDARWMPNPIDIETFSPCMPHRDGPTRVLVISQMHPLKGVDTAFEAIGILGRERDDFEATAINSGPERGLYRDTPRVRFIEPVPHDAMPDLINSHDIVVGQLVIGSLGMSELESMACAKPVIARNEPSSVYQRQPPVLTASSTPEVAQHLRELLDDASLRASVGATGRRWVEEYHGARAVAERLLEVYGRLP